MFPSPLLGFIRQQLDHREQWRDEGRGHDDHQDSQGQIDQGGDDLDPPLKADRGPPRGPGGRLSQGPGQVSHPAGRFQDRRVGRTDQAPRPQRLPTIDPVVEVVERQHQTVLHPPRGIIPNQGRDPRGKRLPPSTTQAKARSTGAVCRDRNKRSIQKMLGSHHPVNESGRITANVNSPIVINTRIGQPHLIIQWLATMTPIVNRGRGRPKSAKMASNLGKMK